MNFRTVFTLKGGRTNGNHARRVSGSASTRDGGTRSDPPSLDGSWRERAPTRLTAIIGIAQGQGAVAQIAVTETDRVLLLPVFQKFADHCVLAFGPGPLEIIANAG